MLAGDLAAGWSKTGKIGTYGGQPFAGVTRFMDGLYAGIKYYNKLHSTTVTLLGWDGDKNGTFINGDNPWNDPAKGDDQRPGMRAYPQPFDEGAVPSVTMSPALARCP